MEIKGIKVCSFLECHFAVNYKLIIVEHNQPPAAVAGIDRVIWLPVESVTLDGSNSTDDQRIDSYQWNMLRYD